jgi:hypothetical protein
MEIPMPRTPELYVHSPKAIRIGAPGEDDPTERRLFVVKNWQDDYVIAWKCTITRDGIGHPSHGYVPIPVSVATLLEFQEPQESNGSVPTAVFRPDSFYTRIDVRTLKKIVGSMPARPTKTCPHCGSVITKKELTR